MKHDFVRQLEGLEAATLEEVENDRWGPAPDDATYLIRTAHELRTVPLGELGPEGLRLLICQHIGLDVLMPMAVGVLQTDPLAEGDFYPGDLLAAVLRVPQEWFGRHPAAGKALDTIVASVDPDTTDEDGYPVFNETAVPELLREWKTRGKQRSS